MALRGSGTPTGAVASILVPFPAAPNNPVAGDIILIFVETDGANAGVNPPSGWAHVPGSPQVAAGATLPTTLSILWRRFQTGDTEPTINSVTSGTANHITVQAHVFSGRKATGDPWNATAAAALTDASADVSIPGLTTTVDGCDIIAVCSDGFDGTSSARFSGWANASLGGLTEIADYTRNTGNGGGFGAAYGVKASAGTVDATTATCVDTTCQGRITIALEPAGGTPGTISPEVIASSAQVFAPAARAGGAIVIAAIIASTGQVQPPTVAAGTSATVVTPARIEAGAVVATPAVVQGTTVGWLAGWAKRKAVTFTYPSTDAYGPFVQFEVTDPAMTAVPTGDGDITVTAADGTTEWPSILLVRTATRIRLSVALPGPALALSTISGYVYVRATAVAARVADQWGGRYTVPAGTVGPTVTVKDGWGATTTNDAWCHPGAIKVPAGSWMKFKDAAELASGVGTVTHVRLDTQYPAGNDQFEVPYVLYSCDDGATWAEFNASINPLEASPRTRPGGVAGDTISDNDLCIDTNGDLVCVWRYIIDSDTRHLHHVRISGAHLGNATAGTIWDPALPSNAYVAPSLIIVSDDLWYMFTVSSISFAVQRWTSTDQGLTYGSPTNVILANSGALVVGAVEIDRGFWHGAAAGPFNGWYYYCLGEGGGGGVNIGSDFRLFRSNDLTHWEPSRRLCLVRTPGTIMVDAAYNAKVFEKSDGSLALIFAGYEDGHGHHVGVVAIDPETPQALTADQAFKYDLSHTSYYDQPSVAQGIWDMAEGGSSGLADLSGNGRTLSAVGSPTQVASVGYDYDGNDRHDTGYNLGGAQYFDVEVDFTVTAAQLAAAGSTDQVVCGIRGAAAQALRVYYRPSQTPDYLSHAIAFTDGSAYSNTGATQPANLCTDGNRHALRIRHDGARVRFYLDGDEYAEYTEASTLVDVSAGFSLGGWENPQTIQYGKVRIHRCAIYTFASAPPAYSEYIPVAVFTAGTEDVPASGATVAPALIASTAQVPAATLAHGYRTASPELVASAAQVFGPQLVAGVPAGAVAPARIESGNSVPAPTLQRGVVLIVPALVASAANVRTPTLAAGVPACAIAPATIAGSSNVLAPTLVRGASRVLPALIGSTSGVPAPSLVHAPVAIAPAATGSAVQVFAPVLAAGVPPGSVGPARIESTTSVPAPALLRGAVTIGPAVIGSSAAVLPPVIVRSAVLVAPSCIDSTATVHEPGLVSGEQLRPQLIAATAAVFALRVRDGSIPRAMEGSLAVASVLSGRLTVTPELDAAPAVTPALAGTLTVSEV
jgi:carbonic anhydrase/acetyltransferase-like protein (isoleucine patch superfamily)